MSMLPRFPVLAIVASAALASTLGGCVYQNAAFKASHTTAVTHVAGMPLKVDTENGGITVLAGEGDQMVVVAEVKAATQERADQTQIVAERDPSGLMTISMRWPDGARQNSEGASILIKMPDVKGVYLTTENGAVRVAKCDGEAKIATSNGAIDLRDHSGTAILNTSNGSITVASIGGAVKAETSNGAIRVSDASGDVNATTVNGSVKVSLAEDDAAGKVEIETSNGGVTFKPGKAFGGTFTVNTSNGPITLPSSVKVMQRSKHQATIVFGNGSGAGGSIKTSNGQVTVE